MSEAGPLLRSGRLWAERESRCLTIIDRALVLLSEEGDLPETESELNRRLYFCLLAATRELYPDDVVAPISECNNQPDLDDEARSMREQKRPDFQWVYLDRYESDPGRSCKQFVVECKRLGEPCRVDWVFNVNYVDHGIRRFRDRRWAYGQRFASGAMVGYWQSMGECQVLDEVNERSRMNSIPELVIVGAWNMRGVSRLVHVFDRPFPLSPFRLHHLWLDLRGRT